MVQYYITVTPLNGVHALKAWTATVGSASSDIREALLAAVEVAERQQDEQETE